MTGTAARLYLVVLLALTSSGCQLVEGIFRAGMWVGIILVLLVLVLVVWIFSRLRKPRF